MRIRILCGLVLGLLLAGCGPSGTDTANTGGAKTASAKHPTFDGSAPDGDDLLGKPAPDLSVTSLDGKEAKVSDMKGKVVMLDFWATWCPPCKASLPENEKLHKELSSKGLQIMAISDEERAPVAAFIKENSYTFPVFTGGPDEISRKYLVKGIPTTVILDREGYVVAYLVGLQEPETIQKALRTAGLEL